MQVKQRSKHLEKSRQVRTTLALLSALTALLTTVVFVVITTGKRFESSELFSFAAAALTLVFVFTSFLTLVNEEPSLLVRAFRNVLLPGFPQSQKRIEVYSKQLQLMRNAKLQAEKAASAEKQPIDTDFLIRRSLNRLEAEIAEVRRRGGINLAMGMSITLLGLGILGYAVYAAPTLQASPAELATYFLPRVSLALVTEMFAYFFLRLYKISMTETKFFQNELTGAEARAMSILLVSKQDSPDLIASIATSFAGLDRNHVLEKGQTTVEIEQARIESDSIRGLAGAISRPRRWMGSKKDEPTIKAEQNSSAEVA